MNLVKTNPEVEGREAGFSVVEMIVAVSLVMLAIIPMYSVFDSMVQKEADQSRLTILQGDVRLVVDGMVRELRQAFSGDPADPPIQALSASGVTFLTPDRSTPYRIRRISYTVQDGAVVRSSVLSNNNSDNGPPWEFGAQGAGVAVLSRITEPSGFVFRDENGNATSVRASVRTVEITFTLDATSTQRSPGPQTYSATVDIRSRT